MVRGQDPENMLSGVLLEKDSVCPFAVLGNASKATFSETCCLPFEGCLLLELNKHLGRRTTINSGQASLICEKLESFGRRILLGAEKSDDSTRVC